MYPNNDQPANPADYLNQIAPKVTKRTDFLKQKPIMIGAVVLVIFFVIMIFAAIVGGLSGGTTPIKTLSARLSSTNSTVDSATTNIKNTKLRALNSNLKLYLTNTIRDYTPILTAQKIDIKNIDKKIISAESDTKILAVLEDARLNAVFDMTYAREMTYKLDTILSLMNKIKSSNNDKLKTFLDSAYKNLKPIQKQFADYNAANS